MLVQPFFTQMRFVVAGILAGAWDVFSGIGAQRMKLAQIGLAGLNQNQATRARALGAQNTDWQQLARYRRDITKVAHRPSEP